MHSIMAMMKENGVRRTVSTYNNIIANLGKWDFPERSAEMMAQYFNLLLKDKLKPDRDTFSILTRYE